ncbi:MAG: DinB family protein [Anaerolineales bacterium]
MIIELIRNLYQYNAWANARILDTATQFSPDQLRAEASASFGSVHGTLVHILGAQWLWLVRWQGNSPSAMFDPPTFPDLDSLRARWDQIERETHDFVAACTEADLARIIAYRNFQNEPWAYPLWQQMIHQVNHATQHRSEVAVILTQFGYLPGWLDFLYFVDLRNAHE